MSDITLPPIDPKRYFRTNVPVIIGAILGWLVTRFPAVADAIVWADAQLPILFPGFDWRELLYTVVIAGVIAVYYWGASQLGRRWPKLEKWLIGSSAVPTYTAR